MFLVRDSTCLQPSQESLDDDFRIPSGVFLKRVMYHTTCDIRFTLGDENNDERRRDGFNYFKFA